MKNDQYFPHDVTAHNNMKLLLLKADKGLEGYGVYWCLLEYLRMQKNYSMPFSLLPALAREFRLSTEYLSDIIRKYDLFVLDDGQYFSSPGLSKRMKPLDEKRKTMAAKKDQAFEVASPEELPKRTQRRKNTVSMVDSQQKYAPEVNTSIVGTIIPIIVDSPAKESEITCSKVMQNSAKTTQNALLQNADNERIATCSLEEESKVEKDKGEYGCCGTTTARIITSTTTNNCQVSILPFLACHKKEKSKEPTSKLLVSDYFDRDCSYELFNLLHSSSIACLTLRPPQSKMNWIRIGGIQSLA